MSRIPNTDHTFECAWVNTRLRADPTALIEQEERRFTAQVKAVGAALGDSVSGLRFVMLCGPSSAGKTTTTRLLCEAVRSRGVRAAMISLDDFYRDMATIPLTADGEKDIEAPTALDVTRLHACVRELAATGTTRLPRFDFEHSRPTAETVPLTVADRTVVFLEGIHAFSPLILYGIPDPVRVYVNAHTRFVDGERVLLGRQDIRLSRRLLRDERTRATAFLGTMAMWDSVMDGFRRYILPYVDTADYVVDTTIGYEPTVLAAPMRERLPQLFGTAYEETARRLYEAYGQFASLPLTAVPADSVLREFL